MTRKNGNLMKGLTAFSQKSRFLRQTPARSGSPKTWWANSGARAVPGVGPPAGGVQGLRREEIAIAGVVAANQ